MSFHHWLFYTLIVLFAFSSVNCVAQEPAPNQAPEPIPEPNDPPLEPPYPPDEEPLMEPNDLPDNVPDNPAANPEEGQEPIQQAQPMDNPPQQIQQQRGPNFRNQMRQQNNLQQAAQTIESFVTQSSEFKDFTISGPYTYKDLTIFFVHAPDKFPSQGFLTLNEALEQKLVVVYETSSVNTLAIENISEQYHIYLQAGDIVKGGKQDRTMGYDMVLSPKSGRMDLPAFCVESGRWRGRGQENVQAFSENSAMVSSKDLKRAVRGVKSQSEVWENVGQLQSKLSKNVGEDVRDERSQSSLQLALENEKLQTLTTDYIAHFEKVPQQQSNVRGFVFAIQGKINSAEIYGSSTLFTKMWNKLLQSAVVETIAEADQKVQSIPAISQTQVQEFLLQVEQAQAQAVKVGTRTKNVEQATEAVQMFEARDAENSDEWIHRQYIVK